MSYSQPNSIPYRSSDGSNASKSGQPKKRFQLPPESGSMQFSAYALEQDFEIVAGAFPPAPKNTVSTDSAFGLSDTKAILTALSFPSDIGGDIVRFSGTFNIVPASWSDEKELPFSFPGFPGIIGQPGARNVFTDKVATRIQHDYFVIDPDHIISGVADGTPGTATSLLDSAGVAVKVVFKRADIPIISKSIFCVALSGAPDYSNRVESLIVNGGSSFGTQTQPTKETYQSWIANASSLKWSSDVWPGNNNIAGTYGQLVANDSETSSYAGNIIERVTMYVLAK